jgi:hypothetical protein
MARDYCTMWADGFTRLPPHRESGAAFVLTSPDKPAAQKAIFAIARPELPRLFHCGDELHRDMDGWGLQLNCELAQPSCAR